MRRRSYRRLSCFALLTVHDLVLVACMRYRRSSARTACMCTLSLSRGAPFCAVSTARSGSQAGPRLTGTVLPLRICWRWRLAGCQLWTAKGQLITYAVVCVHGGFSKQHSTHTFQKERCRNAQDRSVTTTPVLHAARMQISAHRNITQNHSQICLLLVRQSQATASCQLVGNHAPNHF